MTRLFCGLSNTQAWNCNGGRMGFPCSRLDAACTPQSTLESFVLGGRCCIARCKGSVAAVAALLTPRLDLAEMLLRSFKRGMMSSLWNGTL